MNGKRYSLHFGINKREAQYEVGTKYYLNAAVNDAEKMYKLVRAEGFEHTVEPFFNERATLKNFMTNICRIKDEIQPGDLFVLTFSGHGDLMEDTNNDEDDPIFRDGKSVKAQDEAWCFYDGYVIDDQLNAILKMFPAGVKIFIISDSCYSGEMWRSLHPNEPIRMRSMGSKKKDFDASVIVLAASQEDEQAMELWSNGLLTSYILQAWMKANSEGKINDNYDEFYQRIIKLIPPEDKEYQLPDLHKSDEAEKSFYNEVPFLNRMKKMDK